MARIYHNSYIFLFVFFLLFTPPVISESQSRLQTSKEVERSVSVYEESCQCTINYRAGCELAVKKDQQILFKEKWHSHTNTHTHTTVSSQWIKQKHSFWDFLNCQFSLGCLETNLQPIDNLSFYYTCGGFLSFPPHLNTYRAIPGKSASSVSRLNFSGQFEKPPWLL